MTGCCCFATTCCQCFIGNDIDLDDLTNNGDNTDNTVGLEIVPLLTASRMGSGSFGAINTVTDIDLFLPGRIVHIMEDQPPRYKL